MTKHFDGILEDDERSPNGFKKLKDVLDVLIDPNTGRLVITGRPYSLHNCDQRGCGSIEHKIAEFSITTELLEPIQEHINEDEVNNK